jgi:hypothetical protein
MVEIRGLDEGEHRGLEAFVQNRNDIRKKIEEVRAVSEHFAHSDTDGKARRIVFSLPLYADGCFVRDLLSALGRQEGRYREQLDALTLTLETGRKPGGDRDD